MPSFLPDILPENPPIQKPAYAGNKPVYLPGLNGIRAIAALIVVASHCDEFAYLYGKHEAGFKVKGMAAYAVTLFFVLSGYLITYLLILEKEKFKKIQFKKFYTRRILRIWPIYYLVILVAFLLVSIGGILPEDKDHLLTLFYYLFLIPNVPFALGGMFSIITPLWSVGVEEQFYAFWPLVMDKAKNIFAALLAIIGIYMCLKVGLQYSPFQKLFHIVFVTRIDSMAMGGIGAYLVLNKHRVLNIIYNKWLQAACWLVLLGSVVMHAFHVFTLIDNELYSAVFLVLIMNVSTNPKTLVNLENKPFNFLGKISYGLYVYHMVIIFTLHYFLARYITGLNNTAAVVVIYLCVLLISIAIASLSYQYFEQPFLKIKKKYMRITSTNNGEVGNN